MTNEILKTALRFAKEGIVTVPVAPDGSKRPGLSTWKQYQETRPTQDELLGWFNNDKVQGLGVITGPISNNLLMIEFEGRAVEQKLHLRAKEAMELAGLGYLWQTLTDGYSEITPSGGIHFLMYIDGPPVDGNTKLASKAGEDGGCLIETRGSGGFCIVAGSGGTAHPTGKSWEMIAGSIETIPVISHFEMNELFIILQTFDEMPKPEITKQELVKREFNPALPGDDYNEKMTWEEILEPVGWKKVFTQAEKTLWRRPGKNEGISASTNHGGYDTFYIFSTSTSFEANKSYSKFAVYAHLHHRDDFKAAANALRNLGYGAQNLNSFDLGNTLMPTNQLQGPLQVTAGDLGPDESSWKPIPLKDYFDGLFAAPIATILKRTDGAGLIYTGRVHSIYGESESGKSWIAQIASAECLKNDKKVIYIDFESDAVDIVNRLKALGVSRANLLQYFTYIRPDGPRDIDDPYWKAILEQGSAELVVIDGVTESLTMWGGQTKDNDEITRWMRVFPRTVASASGAAVVLIDHITKNAETRGRFAIGGQAKLATIDGAAYLVEPLEALAPGRIGSLTMRVTKDRPGFIRKISGMWRKSDRTQETAIFTIDSTRAQMQYVIGVPLVEDEVESNKEIKKLKEIAEFIHNYPGSSRRVVQDGISGSKDAIGNRIGDLVAGGWVENRGNDRSFILYITDAGQHHFNLLSATVTQLKAN